MSSGVQRLREGCVRLLQLRKGNVQLRKGCFGSVVAVWGREGGEGCMQLHKGDKQQREYRACSGRREGGVRAV